MRVGLQRECVAEASLADEIEDVVDAQALRCWLLTVTRRLAMSRSCLARSPRRVCAAALCACLQEPAQGVTAWVVFAHEELGVKLGQRLLCGGPAHVLVHARVPVVARGMHLNVVVAQGPVRHELPEVLLAAVRRCVVVFLPELGVHGLGVELLRNTPKEQDGPGLVGGLRIDVFVHALQVRPELLAREVLRLHVRRVMGADVRPVHVLPPDVAREGNDL